MDMNVFRDRFISDNHWSVGSTDSKENLDLVTVVIAVMLEISDFPVVQPIG
jgi:hypothetical protein